MRLPFRAMRQRDYPVINETLGSVSGFAKGSRLSVQGPFSLALSSPVPRFAWQTPRALASGDETRRRHAKRACRNKGAKEAKLP